MLPEIGLLFTRYIYGSVFLFSVFLDMVKFEEKENGDDAFSEKRKRF